MWTGRGNSPILISDNSSEGWLIYHTDCETLEEDTRLKTQDIGSNRQVVARKISSDETLGISDPGIDCDEIAAIAYRHDVMVVWNQLTGDGNYQVFEGHLSDGPPRQITSGLSSAVHPDLTVDQKGVPCLVYQKSDQRGRFNIYLRRKIDEKWTDPILISDVNGNNWCPAIASCADGKLAVAWDSYASGSYDIYLRFINPNMSLEPVMRLTGDNLFHANVSLSPAPDGAVWIAWNRGTADWGKDNEVYRSTRIPERNYLHTRRLLEVRRAFPSRVLPVYPPVQDFLDSKLPGLLHERPKLCSTPDSPLYLAFRYNEGELRGGHRNEKRWQAMVTCYDGRDWEKPVELEGAFGLSTGNISILPHFGGNDQMIAAASGEGKASVDRMNTKVSIHQISMAAKKIEVKEPPVVGRVFALPEPNVPPVSHSIEHDGQKYSVYFGDLHRHTELSYCRTSVDGSLEEACRYAKDTAVMDFVMTADHDHQEQAPDIWSQTMRNADRFYIPGHFSTFFGYEWIGGRDNRRHRNIVSTVRVPVPPFDYVDGHRDVRNMWKTLQRGKAITIPHHTACGMSLMWGQDPGEASDPVLEPLVEIFQASRCSSEYLNCPTLCNSIYQNGGEFDVEGGFVDDALKQDIRMGFIASSDHMSTHRSYACVYATENTREELMKAMIARRTYGATDRIICEFFLGGAVMGEEIKADAHKALEVCIRFAGTGRIREITLLRDSIPFKIWNPKGSGAEINVSIDSIEAKGHYFYTRMIQEDSNMAWSSPIWVD